MQRASLALALMAVAPLVSGCVMRPPGQIAARKALSAQYAHNNFGTPLTPVAPGFGMVYADYKAPLLPGGTRNVPLPTQKVGKAKTRFLSVLWYPVIAAWDDATIETAAKNGGITNVEYAEYEFMQVLGTYGEFVVTVYGN